MRYLERDGWIVLLSVSWIDIQKEAKCGITVVIILGKRELGLFMRNERINSM